MVRGDLVSALLKSFGDRTAPPERSADLPQLNEYWESREFLSKLRNVRWNQLLEEDEMTRISNDAGVWTGYMPRSWFPYYLPAMIAVAYSGSTAFASNLRGLLREILSPEQGAPAWAREMHDCIWGELTESQRDAIDAVVSATDQ